MNFEEDTPVKGTDFDQAISNRQIEMIKTAIPFMPYHRQRTLSLIVKISELRNTIRYFNSNEDTLLAACSDDTPENRMVELLNALRIYCSKAEQEQIDSIFQMIMAMQIMRDEL